MNIEKLTEKYTLAKEGTTWFLYLGSIKKGEDTTTKLLFTDVDSSTFNLKPTCGCLAKEQKIIDDKTVEVSVSYNQCDNPFKKTFQIKNNGKITELKLQGTCRNL